MDAAVCPGGLGLYAYTVGANNVVYHGAQDAARQVVIAVHLARLVAQGNGAFLRELVGAVVVSVELAPTGGGVCLVGRCGERHGLRKGRASLQAQQAGAGTKKPGNAVGKIGRGELWGVGHGGGVRVGPAR